MIYGSNDPFFSNGRAYIFHSVSIKLADFCEYKQTLFVFLYIQRLSRREKRKSFVRTNRSFSMVRARWWSFISSYFISHKILRPSSIVSYSPANIKGKRKKILGIIKT